MSEPPIPCGDEDLLRTLHREAAASGRLAAVDLDEREEVAGALEPLVASHRPLMPRSEVRDLAGRLAARVAGLGPLDALLADPSVTEIMVNGPDSIWVECAGRVSRVAVGIDQPEIERVIERVLTPLGLRCDRTAPVVDARLPDGSRFHAVVPPVAVDGPYLTLRRFGTRALPLEALAPDADVRALLEWAVRSGWNVLVCGATSSGKTTLLNALSARIPPDERVVTIEETAELRLRLRHAVRLEARPPNAEGVGAVDIDDLVRAALRMRPDRIVVGEVRGAEARSMLDALNTGHDGSLSTIHANAPSEALHRLVELARRPAHGVSPEAVAAEVARSIDAVAHVARRRTGARSVVEVVEVGRDDPTAVRRLWTAAEGLTRVPRRPPRRHTAGRFTGAPPSPTWSATVAEAASC